MTLKLAKNWRFWGIDINVFMGDLLATFKDLFFACKRTMSQMKSCISCILKAIWLAAKILIKIRTLSTESAI